MFFPENPSGFATVETLNTDILPLVGSELLTQTFATGPYQNQLVTIIITTTYNHKNSSQSDKRMTSFRLA
jgi:hypothetical protein